MNKINKTQMAKGKARKNKTTELVIKVQPVSAIQESDLLPQKEGGKYMIPQTWVSEKQVLKMVQATPAKYIYTRPAKGGGVWKYVTGSYIEKVLNFTFGWNWDFEIMNQGREGDQVWVLGKLTVKDDKGHYIVKTQFGRADVKFRRGSKDPLDFGNDLKAASTDALKKCASLLGIASDIYGKNEFKEETGVDIEYVNKTESGAIHGQREDGPAIALKPGQVIGPDGEAVYLCCKCDDPIDERVADYSLKMHGKRLCRDCQPKK